ncbi:hypothetical protein ERJ70_05540 [Sediminibacillus dalangtanensis]|uniref:Uncharacterized protein n=1 Tax=Sediminibacillus dalangtanensis TaxID=2729421 RepID=A0ABX7VQ93_9BACI|nr:hypothetical protein [Sediminibacillus dalangtanensis]QTM98806.1 hypothetical protein ERJ70_05540 [Sediminibacillus dalangtanensis]
MTNKLASLTEIYQAKADIEQLKQQKPELYEQLLHVVSLTRQLQIKYGYLGSLLMEESTPKYQPKFVRESVLSLYLEEVEKLKKHQDIGLVRDIIERNRQVSESKICLLLLGAKPELLQGSMIMN